MSNIFTKRPTDDLLAIGALIQSKVSSVPNEFAITTGELQSLNGAFELLTNAAQAQVAAQAAEKAATTAKNEARNVIVHALNAIGKTVYANYAVSDPMLQSIGYAPRSSGPSRPVAPTQVTDLTVAPTPEGDVTLAFSRNANRATTTFLIETSPDGTSWTQVAATTRTKATLSGFAPGVGAWFRVTATNSVGEAAPSPKTAIYTPSPAPVALRLAA